MIHSHHWASAVQDGHSLATASGCKSGALSSARSFPRCAPVMLAGSSEDVWSGEAKDEKKESKDFPHTGIVCLF